MDATGLGILAVYGLLIAAAITLWLRRRRRALAWPTIEATVETTAIERLPGRHPIPFFVVVVGYSFSVGGERYGGIFGLSAAEEPGSDYLKREIIGKKIAVRYDPKEPSENEPTWMEFQGMSILEQSDASGWTLRLRD